MMCIPNRYEKIFISPPDSNGYSFAYRQDYKNNKIIICGTKPLQETIDDVYKYLNNNEQRTQSFWNLNVICSWADQSATEKQLALLEELLRENGVTYNDIDKLTKYEASKMITKLMLD